MPVPDPAESPGPFSRPRKKLQLQQTPSTDQERCHPMQFQTSPRHLPDAWPTAVRPPRLPLHTGFNQLPFIMGINSPLIVLRCDRLISPHNPKSRVDIRCRLVAHKSNMVLSTLRHSGFRGFNVLLRGLLSRTWKQRRLFAFTPPWCSRRGRRRN